MVYQTRGRALALGARDADGLCMELAEEKVGLRRDLHIFRVEILERDAWCLDDNVIVVHRLKIAFSRMRNTFHCVFVGHRNDGFGQELVQETQGRLTFATEAENEDALAAKPVQYLVKHKDVILGFAQTFQARNDWC